MRSARRNVLCLLIAAVVLFSGIDGARAAEPAPGGGPAGAPAAAHREPASPKAKRAPKKKAPKKKGSRKRAARKKAGKRAGKKGGKPAARKRPAGPGRRDTRPVVDERATPGVEARSYTVRDGDSLWSIAKKTGVDPDTLAALNDVGPSDLRAGRSLRLEAPPAPSAAASPAAPAEPAATAEPAVAARSVGDAGEAAPTVRERIVAAARKLLDIPYRFGGSTLLGIDCSGYVQKVFGFFGVALPRTAREMFGLGTEVSREELSLGDLVFFRTYASFPSHVGIYIGNDMFIHASARDRKVTVDSLDAPYYLRNFIGGKRLPVEGEAGGN